MKKLILGCLFIGPLSLWAQDAGLNDKEAKDAMKELRKKKNEIKDTTYWQTGGVAQLDFSQIYLNNWAGGGFSSVSGKGLVSFHWNLIDHKTSWDNSLDLGYGLVRQFDTDPNDGTDDNLTYKSDDRIDFASKFGRHAFKDFYYSGLANFRTQFAPGFSKPGETTKISDFLAPAYVIISLGMDYRPNKKLTLFASPATSKTTIVNDPGLSAVGAFGVTPGETIRYEVGGYVKLVFNTKLADNITYTTKLDVFSNYLNNPENIDISWENLISVQLWKVIALNVSTHLIYDDDIKSRVIYEFDQNGNISGSRLSPGVQFKQVLGVGITYKFGK